MAGVTLTWLGGEHDFALRIGELRALQDRCEAGPEEIFNRLRAGTWRVNDITETLRLGLIGGGMSRVDAGKVVSEIIEDKAIANFKITAIAVMANSLLGVGDDPVGEPAGETSPPESGSSQSSTETAL